MFLTWNVEFTLVVRLNFLYYQTSEIHSIFNCKPLNNVFIYVILTFK